jgi:hypothetical protein
MATIDQLVEQSRLLKLDEVLDPGELEERLIFLHPRVAAWTQANLEALENDGFYDNVPTPQQQADDLFYEFISGSDLISDWPPHAMTPYDTGVWELRTADLRFFGWFWRKSIFILSAVDTKVRCLELGLYAGYRRQCVNDRDTFDLDPPAFCTGELVDVL